MFYIINTFYKKNRQLLLLLFAHTMNKFTPILIILESISHSTSIAHYSSPYRSITIFVITSAIVSLFYNFTPVGSIMVVGLRSVWVRVVVSCLVCLFLYNIFISDHVKTLVLQFGHDSGCVSIL